MRKPYYRMIPHFRLFALAVLLINISPGATFVAVSSEAVSKGLKAGLYTAFGAGSALLIYAILSWLGLSTLIIENKTAFLLIKYAGIAYLLYCGIKAFLQKPFDINSLQKAPIGESYKKGMFVNLLNPFTPVLFLTLIPQFMDRSAENVSMQLLMMGLWICVSATVVNTIWALLFSFSGKCLSNQPGFWKGQRYVTGLLFLYLAVRFAFFK